MDQEETEQERALLNEDGDVSFVFVPDLEVGCWGVELAQETSHTDPEAPKMTSYQRQDGLICLTSLGSDCVGTFGAPDVRR